MKKDLKIYIYITWLVKEKEIVLNVLDENKKERWLILKVAENHTKNIQTIFINIF